MTWLQRVWKFQTSEGHKALLWRSYVGFKKCRKDPTKKKMVEQKQWKREQRRKATLWHCNARMPTQTWAQSNQTKTVIEVLACAQTKNKLRPRQGKRLTDQVNLQSRDRSVFECFLTLLHREGKLCFCLLSRGSLKHKCCENEELGCWEVKANMCYKGHEWKMSGNEWFDFSLWKHADRLGWPLSFVSPRSAFILFQIFKLEKKMLLQSGTALPSQKKYPITEDIVDDINKAYSYNNSVELFFESASRVLGSDLMTLWEKKGGNLHRSPVHQRAHTPHIHTNSHRKFSLQSPPIGSVLDYWWCTQRKSVKTGRI